MLETARGQYQQKAEAQRRLGRAQGQIRESERDIKYVIKFKFEEYSGRFFMLYRHIPVGLVHRICMLHGRPGASLKHSRPFDHQNAPPACRTRQTKTTRSSMISFASLVWFLTE